MGTAPFGCQSSHKGHRLHQVLGTVRGGQQIPVAREAAVGDAILVSPELSQAGRAHTWSEGHVGTRVLGL